MIEDIMERSLLLKVLLWVYENSPNDEELHFIIRKIEQNENFTMDNLTLINIGSKSHPKIQPHIKELLEQNKKLIDVLKRLKVSDAAISQILSEDF